MKIDSLTPPPPRTKTLPKRFCPFWTFIFSNLNTNPRVLPPGEYFPGHTWRMTGKNWKHEISIYTNYSWLKVRPCIIPPIINWKNPQGLCLFYKIFAILSLYIIYNYYIQYLCYIIHNKIMTITLGFEASNTYIHSLQTIKKIKSDTHKKVKDWK